MKKEQDRDALVRLSISEDCVARVRELLTQAEWELAKERIVYAATRPLTEAERADLAKHVADGGSLCCEPGLAWLLERLPRPWAHAINGYAYEHMACGSMSASAREMHVERLLALKIDRFPGDE